MTLTLPPVLAAMVAAHNAGDVEAFLACLSADAIVRDDGRVHYGHAAVRAWFAGLRPAGGTMLEVVDLYYVDGEPVLTARTDDPQRGVATVRLYAGVEDGKIVALKVVR